MKRIKNLAQETRILLRSVPSLVVAAYIVALVSMNLLANKLVPLNIDYLLLDCGFFISWAVFLTMDVVTRHFGPRAATILSVVALFCNLFSAMLFFFCAKLPGIWGESYVPGSEEIINNALDNTLSGNWFVVFGSSVAFISSAVVNNFLNFFIGKGVEGSVAGQRGFNAAPAETDKKAGKRKKNFGTFAIRSYVSTFIGQFVDNLVFALIVSHTLFGLSLLQCFICAVTGAVAELLFEVVSSPAGYAITKSWERDGVGAEYFAFLEKNYADKQVCRSRS
ncbi:MAG: VUT family protein [Lachnospiraceae bacterium]|nr:VUT family protein [Lachnospiraceae bacterium]